MKLSLEKSPFLKALSHGQSVVEKRTTVAILNHVLLTAMPGKLLLTSTDMDMALIETIQADVGTPGTACVPAHLIYEIVRKLNDATITLDYNSETSQLVVSSGRSRFELPSLPTEDFPQLTHSELTHFFTLPAPVLKHLIDTTRFAMSAEEIRYNLNGIHFHTLSLEDGRNVLRAVATDMHRLACVGCDAPEGSHGMPEIIVGRKTITEIRKLLDEAEQPVQIGVSNSRIEFVLDGNNTSAVLSSRLLDGTFPDYQEAISIESDKSLVTQTKAFAEAVDRVGTVVSDKVRAIKLKISKNLAVLSAVSSDLGSATEELDVDFPYPDVFELCFNVKYLMDIAQQINEEEMELLLVDGDSTVLLKPVNNANAVFILMPMRA